MSVKSETNNTGEGVPKDLRKPGLIHPNPRLSKTFICSLFLLVAMIGWILANLRAEAVDQRFRDQLLRQAVEIASTLPPELVASLTFTTNDLLSTSFIQLRDTLSAYANSFPNRGIYTMALRDGDVVFGPESYPVDDPMASSPGTVYIEFPDTYFSKFQAGLPWVDGPMVDEYGTFVSGLAPVKDPLTGETLLFVGIDILADDWSAIMRKAMRPPLIGALALTVLMIMGTTAFVLRNRITTELSLPARHLETILAVIFGLAITAGTCLWVNDAETRERRAIFANLAELQSKRIVYSVQQIPQALHTLVRFFESSNAISAHEFSRFALPMLSDLRLDALGWIPVATSNDWSSLSYWSDQQGLGPLPRFDQNTTLDITDLGAVYFPALYIIPDERREHRLGWNHASDPRLHNALRKSLLRDGMSAAGLANSPWDNTAQDLYFGYLRIPPHSDPYGLAPENSLVFAAFRLNSVISRVVDGISRDMPLLSLELLDVSADALPHHRASHGEAAVLLRTQGHSLYHAIEDEFFERPLIVMGRALMVRIAPTRHFLQAYSVRGGRLTALAGTIATVIFAAFVGLIRERHVALEREIRVRTADLREREENLATTLNSIGDAVIVTDAHGRIVRMNPVAEAMTGYTFAEVKNLPHQEILTLLDSHTGLPIGSPIEQALATRSAVELDSDITLVGKRGISCQVDDSAAPIRDDQGSVIGVIMVFRDVTETYQARQTLEQSEARYRRLFSEMSSGFALHEIILDDEGKPRDSRFLEINEAFETQTQFSSEDLIGKTLLEAMPDTEPFWIETFGQVALTGTSRHFEHESHVLGRHYDVIVYSPEPLRFAVIFSDITDRRQAEINLAHRESFQRVLMNLAARFVNLAPDQIDQATLDGLADIGRFASVDRAYRFRYDRAAATMTNTHEWCEEGVTPFLDRLQNVPFSVFPELVAAHLQGKPLYIPLVAEFDESHPMRASLQEQKIQSLITIPLINDGESIGFIGFDSVREPRSWSDDEIQLLKVMADLLVNALSRRQTEEARIHLERQMLQAQKLESLGVLAGGIAHDFNNILTGILGNADLALRDVSASSPLRPNLESIVAGSRRAADLCRQMLAYAGKGRFVIENFRVNELIEEMVHLLHTSISKRALLNLQLEPNLPPLRGDASQIRQIVLNLVINASEAIAEKSGTISISTGVRNLKRAELDKLSVEVILKEGPYVSLEVADTGSGMSPETLARIFDPFFTTKFTGRGLGLAAVLGIVNSHHGALRATSAVNRGTTFTLFFPALEANADVASPLLPPPPDSPSSRNGTILLIDDEESIRVIGSRMLERVGYTVLLAEDGAHGVDVYRAHHKDITAVILDLTMPHMNGEEAFRAIRAINPQARVIMASGYSKDELSERLDAKGLAAFIQKPYTSDILRDVLDAVRADAS